MLVTASLGSQSLCIYIPCPLPSHLPPRVPSFLFASEAGRFQTENRSVGVVHTHPPETSWSPSHDVDPTTTRSTLDLWPCMPATVSPSPSSRRKYYASTCLPPPSQLRIQMAAVAVAVTEAAPSSTSSTTLNTPTHSRNMAIHPEVLWAQRSSESDPTKVRMAFPRSRCATLIWTRSSFAEHPLCHGEPALCQARHRQVRAHTNPRQVRRSAGNVSLLALTA